MWYVSCPCSVVLSILSTMLMQYLVKRKGLDLTDYGKVDGKAAKRQRFEQPTAAQGDGTQAAVKCQVPVEMVEDYESYRKRFWAAVHEHTERGDLNLGEQPGCELHHLTSFAAVPSATVPYLLLLLRWQKAAHCAGDKHYLLSPKLHLPRISPHDDLSSQCAPQNLYIASYNGDDCDSMLLQMTLRMDLRWKPAICLGSCRSLDISCTARWLSQLVVNRMS